jgi:hypothetical protein
LQHWRTEMRRYNYLRSRVVVRVFPAVAGFPSLEQECLC